MQDVSGQGIEKRAVRPSFAVPHSSSSSGAAQVRLPFAPGQEDTVFQEVLRILPRALCRRGLQLHDAADLAQEMITVLLSEMRRVPGSIRNPIAILLHRIPYALAGWRRSRGRCPSDSLDPNRLLTLEESDKRVLGCSHSDGEVTLNEIRCFLCERWPKLNELDLDLLILKYYHGLHAPEVATKIGWKLARLRRAYTRLGKILRTRPGDKPPYP